MNAQLYGHYTSMQGLMGIVKNESIWATNIKFLNDEHEFQHALNLIKEIIPKPKIAKHDGNYPKYLEFRSLIDKKLESLDRYESDQIFTFSFSAETDLLSQWRGYCPKNNGYCVIFDVNELFNVIDKSTDDCHLVKCIYDHSEKKEKLKNLLNKYFSSYIKLISEKEKGSLIENLSRELTLLASYFKHPSFAEEKEHRIVTITPYAPDEKNLDFREGKFSLIPYIKLPAPRKTIKEICIGPNAHKELTKRGLELFLEKSFGFPTSITGDVDISFSNTPYRSW